MSDTVRDERQMMTMAGDSGVATGDHPDRRADARSPVATAGGTALDVEQLVERHRRELRAHCYRMLGSAFDAEDAVQETMVRAWRHFDTFEGRSSTRSWLYRIATNVCLDLLRGRRRRALPADLAEPRPASAALGPTRGEAAWITPMPDGLVVDPDDDPAEQAITRESVRLAFVAALQHLPPRQRAVLILREVLRWHADEVADLLGMSITAVNSALQRARATLAVPPTGPSPEPDAAQQALLARYLDAFERYDVESLVAVLHEDASMQMPPFVLWLRGRDQLGAWYGDPRSAECRGSLMIPLRANGLPAFAQYRPNGPGGSYTPFSIQVIHARGGLIHHIDAFLDPRLFPLFGVPVGPAPRHVTD